MYSVTTDEQSGAQVDALPTDALPVFAEVRVVLELTPWSGDPFNQDHPEGPVRTITFGPSGEGLITYLIVEDARRVDILLVHWLT